MITQEDINTVLGTACKNLGYPITNAALYREVVPEEITDTMIKEECDRLREEIKQNQSIKLPTVSELLDKINELQSQIASLSSQN